MKIFKIEVCNYRLLKAFSMDLEDELSLIIGKNNTGKTSVLWVLDKFLNEKSKFNFDDFNVEYKSAVKNLIEDAHDIPFEDYVENGLELKLFIQYDESDNLSNISRVMMDLDPNNNVITLGFHYLLDYENYLKARREYRDFNAKEQAKKIENTLYDIKGVFDFLKRYQKDFFRIKKRSYLFEIASQMIDPNTFLDLESENITTKEIINFKYISAKRDVTNKEPDSTLSGQTSRIYQRTEASDEQNDAVEKFKDKITETDTQLSDVYKSLFEGIIEKVKIFGGIIRNESEIEIISTLQHRELLEGNTTVVYRHSSDHQLPEHYNGLGYMNLISMIFEIEILVQEFKRDKALKPADINLLFIEEPEAHTHPQMQYVFIKNIKALLREGVRRDDGINRPLQYIITTHSSHIVADSDFSDIKYLKKLESSGVISKNLKDLEQVYADASKYQFLKQYLTVSRAEIFFAEKAILIEGDTERILLPTLMRKVDIEEKARLAAVRQEDQFLPLLSQNISIVEVGAYSQIFEQFIEFLGIKSLIITDLDAVDADGEKCPVADGTGFSNSALSFFFGAVDLNDLLGYTITQRTFAKTANAWILQDDGKLCIVYQTAEDDYRARSFEDAFIHLNRQFIADAKDSFQGLKKTAYFDDASKNAYVLANECIKKKTHFALDILYHSDAALSNWKIPSYIKEGLLWLKTD
ncbi:ATP-dependent endonuclease [Daejeonella sp.]|uniref:ATP-dependent endonuclease n=1 Tax=Daejeonella sp. TaxID=2805397 RepID=UPI0030BA709C